MPGEIKEINVSQLVNYYENPRHAIGSSEEDTLEKLFNAGWNSIYAQFGRRCAEKWAVRKSANCRCLF